MDVKFDLLQCGHLYLVIVVVSCCYLDAILWLLDQTVALVFAQMTYTQFVRRQHTKSMISVGSFAPNYLPFSTLFTPGFMEIWSNIN